MLQHISDHKGFIIRELYTVLGQNYNNGSIVSVVIVILAKHSIKLPDDESLVIRNILKQF